jgi:hypothetical protein
MPTRPTSSAALRHDCSVCKRRDGRAGRSPQRRKKDGAQGSGVRSRRQRSAVSGQIRLRVLRVSAVNGSRAATLGVPERHRTPPPPAFAHAKPCGTTLSRAAGRLPMCPSPYRPIGIPSRACPHAEGRAKVQRDAPGTAAPLAFSCSSMRQSHLGSTLSDRRGLATAVPATKNPLASSPPVIHQHANQTRMACPEAEARQLTRPALISPAASPARPTG